MKQTKPILVLLVVLTGWMYAQDGSLDATFDSDGRTQSPVDNTNTTGYGIAVQSDGKIIIVGHVGAIGSYDLALARFNTDGTLDDTFSDDGLVRKSLCGDSDALFGVALQTDGRIVVVGYTENDSDSFRNMAIVRFTSSGDPDSTFSDDGVLTLSQGNQNDELYEVVIQSDGKIVAVGYSRTDFSADFCVIRVNTDGTLDTSFDSDGIKLISFGSPYDFAKNVALQTDGKIVIVGTMTSSFVEDIAVARLHTDGSFDTSFDSDGMLTTAVSSSYDYAYGVAIDNLNRIVVCGNSSVSGNFNVIVVRYNSDGSLSSTFDSDGKLTLDLDGTDVAYGIAILSDQKIVIAGTTDGIAFVARLDTAGAYDTSFDSDGYTIQSYPDMSVNSVYAMALQSDGNIVTGGYCQDYITRFAVQRFTNSITPLPVELVSFTATPQRSDAELHWATATEVNNYGFEIQRSEIRDQKSESTNSTIQQSNWTSVGFVEGNGNSNSPKEYSFTDKNLTTGRYSYRLKQIDHNGKFKYTQEVEVTVGSVPKVFSLEQNYPNPFNPTTTIGFTLQVSGLTTLKIYDAIGREVATLVNEPLEGGVYHQRTFDAKNLPSGMYFARLQSAEKVQLKKILLLK
ncbi:MAG: T9SS type A sorting domain-containing protein [Bacteroidota bacterium]